MDYQNISRPTIHAHLLHTNILALDPAVNQKTGAFSWRYHLDLWTGWNRCHFDAHWKQVDVKQLHNQMPQTAWVSWCQVVGVWVAVRGSENQLQTESLGPQWPSVEQLSRMRKKCCYSQRNLRSLCCSPSRLHLTFHTQPFRNPFENKVWKVYFSKEVCSFVTIVDFVSACIRICIVVSRLYNIFIFGAVTRIWDHSMVL